jgi:AcrR family transcriptional regulator
MNLTPLPITTTEDTRQRIIQAALHLFARIGYKTATTRAIADAAGVNEVTLFRHFGTKRNILLACMESFNASGFASTFEQHLIGNYRQDILIMARLQIQDTLSSLDMLRLLVCEARNIPELLEAMARGSSGNMARVEKYFQHQLDTGAIRPGLNSVELASLFAHIFSMKLFYDNMFNDNLSLQVPNEAELDRMVDIFVRGTER